MPGGYPGMGMMPNDPNRPKLVTLTRTDFLIQFVWQPPKGSEKPTPEALKTKIAEITKQMKDAEKNKTEITLPTETAIETVSKAASREVETVLTKPATAPPAGPATPAAPPGGAATPAAPPAAPAK
jgi:type IV pilus assembly protein PilM